MYQLTIIFFIFSQEEESAFISLREPIFEERRNHVTKACEQLHRTQSQKILSSLPKLVFAENHGILYCGIPKTGSTFWRKTLKIVENEENFSSLYEFRNSETNMQKKLKTLNEFRSDINESAFRTIVGNATSFLFVREPYGRLFSAYNNKILNPNIVYWKFIGSRVVRTVRKHPSKDSLIYGHDVTFPEMIEFLVRAFENGKGIDQHFAPMHKRCKPCGMRFDYIGKMESFSADAHFIIAQMRRKYKDVYVQFGEFDSGTALDTAQGHVRFLFGVLKNTQNLNYPKYNFFLRTWRDLQVRGHLSKHIDMPLTKDQVSNITREEFFRLIKEALENPMNKTEVKQQRQEALIQAYKSVPLKLMERLKKYVELDCFLFGYDSRPAELFNREHSDDGGSFNYFDSI